VSASASARPKAHIVAAQFGLGLTASQTAEVGSVENWEASLPRATNVAQLTAQRDQIQHTVDAIYQEGVTTHNGNAVNVLIHETTLPGGPAVHAAFLRHFTGYVTSSAPSSEPAPGPLPPTVPEPFARDVARTAPRAYAASDPCWGAHNSVWTRWNWPTGLFGSNAYISVVSKGWCGNGSSISYFGGAYFKQNAGLGFCFANQAIEDSGSWIIFWSWTHMGIWQRIGTDTFLFGCIDGGSFGADGHAHIREAANGYWDLGY
jgi:hypothetical protein